MSARKKKPGKKDSPVVKESPIEKVSPPGKREYLVPVLFCLAYLILAVATAPQYGITWDEAQGDWYIAERNLDYFLTFDKKHLDFGNIFDLYPAEIHPKLQMVIRPWTTMYFGNLLSSVGCKLFFASGLHLDPLLAHHLPNFLMVAGVLAAMFYLVRKKFGLIAAAISLFAIAFQPRFLADVHFNTKDIPYACIMAFTLLMARRAILEKRATLTTAAAVLLGLCTATKLNSPLIPVIIGLWFLISRKEITEGNETSKKEEQKPDNKYFLASLFLSPVIAFLAFFVVWPWLWLDPVGRIHDFLTHYSSLAQKGSPGLQWDTLLLFITVQPPAVLLFGGIGAGMAVQGIRRNNNREVYSFILIWFTLPVLRMLLPHMYNFDGVRHFIEYAIPLGALTAIGAAGSLKWLINISTKYINKQKLSVYVSASIVALPFMLWIISVIAIHPYEITYFNFLIGGTKGAQKRWDEATDYWGSSYRQGIEWLNEHADRGALVVAPVGGETLETVQRLWMRSDLGLTATPLRTDMSSSDLFKALHLQRPMTVYAIYVTRSGWYNKLIREIDAKWESAYVISADGAPILKIMKTEFSPQPIPR